MATFDSSKYDIPTLVAKLRDQRFDGYQPEQLAQVVEKFRDGAGPSGITGAVEALKSIAGALADTEEALRTQLKALGVEWQSRAGGQASAVVAREAGFSGEATAKVEQAAQMLFEQAEAFTRTRNKLPAPEDLRKAGGYTFGDTVFSLFGFETDHAADVRTAEEAKAQAVDALNAYAHDTGHYLGSTSTVDAPAPVSLLSAPGTGVVSGIGGSTAPVPPDTTPTQAQGTKDVTPAGLDTPAMGIPAAGGAGAAAPVAGVTGAAGAAGVAGVTGPAGTARPGTAGPGTPGGTTAGHPGTAGSSGGADRRGAAAAPASGAAGGRAAGFAGDRRASGSSGQHGASAVGSGRRGFSSEPGVASRPGAPGSAGQGYGAGGRFAAGTPGGGVGGGLGASAGAGSGGTGGGPAAGSGAGTGSGPGAGAGSGAGTGAGPGAGAGSAATPAEEALGKGRSAGAMPPSATAPTAVGPGFAAVRAPSGLSGLAEAAPALGAAGASGALAGEGERQSRVGRNTAGHRVHQIPADDLPEEEEARLARRGGHTPGPAATRSILEPAAPRDGEEDVRRFGVDDNDLFTDRRDVSPDTIGDR